MWKHRTEVTLLRKHFIIMANARVMNIRIGIHEFKKITAVTEFLKFWIILEEL